MKASTRRLVTLTAALVAAVAMVIAMLSAPRFFTGSPEAFFTPASASLPEPQPADVTGLDADAPMPDTAILTAKLDAILATQGDGTSFSAQVLDIDTGKVLYEKNGQQRGTPASSLKIATAMAALDTLGGDTRFATSVLLDGETLVLRGGGDVLLGDGPSDEQGTVGYAGLATLAELTAEKLRERGINTVSVWLDDSLFGQSQVNPAWEQSLFTTNNIAPVYPVAHYAGRVSAAPRATYEHDAAAQVRTVFSRALAEQTVPSGSAGGTSSQSPEQRITVVEGGRGAYQGGEELAQVRSAPLRDQIRHMLLVSDNYLTEAIGRLVAINRQLPPEQAAVAVQSVAEKFGAGNLELLDTSGLASGNRVPPADLATLLAAAATSGKPELRELAYSLPISGYSGTMASRLDQDADRGLVRAKTGSLMGVATLSGVTVTAGGRAVAFSIFSFNPDGELAPHRPTIDQAVGTLHACGCR